jgi:hypothetical protein
MPLVSGDKDSSEKGNNTSEDTLSGRPKNTAIAIAFEACRKERERKSKSKR